MGLTRIVLDEEAIPSVDRRGAGPDNYQIDFDICPCGIAVRDRPAGSRERDQSSWRRAVRVR